MEGPASDVGFYLGATSLSDLSDRIEFVDVVQQDDADLAQEVLNLRNELIATEDRLEELQSEARRRQAAAQALQDEVQAKLAGAAEPCSPTCATALAGAKADERAAEKAYQKLLASQSYGGHSSVPLPEGWQGVFEACPVAQPRGFGDGFGAPRYVGGYHLHKGVDIVAPMGTPIYATFDGMASDATNIYGGNAVYVTGKYGATYNAHMTSIAKLGPVQAGDVIGYVGSTGLAGGVTNHNHFEFRPERDALELARELLRLLDHRGRDQPVPAARGRLRLARLRLLISRPSPITSTTPAATSSAMASGGVPPACAGGRARRHRRPARPRPSRSRGPGTCASACCWPGVSVVSSACQVSPSRRVEQVVGVGVQRRGRRVDAGSPGAAGRGRRPGPARVGTSR